MRKAAISFLFIVGVLSSLSAAAWASYGDVLANYNLSVGRFLFDKTGNCIYASIPGQNSVAIIDCSTLAVQNQVYVGPGPQGMALSADGTRLFVALSGTTQIAVMDTTTLGVSYLSVPNNPYALAVGLDGRLYATPANNGTYTDIMQLDGLGNYTGSFSSGVFIYWDGLLQISPDKKTLYFATVSLSPGVLAEYDVSTPTPALIRTNSPWGSLGSNGEDLILSNAGDAIYYVVGSGNSCYNIAKINPTDMSVAGSFNTGPYPGELALSPDDRIAYAVHESSQIDVFDTTSFAHIGQIPTAGQANRLVADASRHLYAAEDGQLVIYDTTTAASHITSPVNGSYVTTQSCTITGTASSDVNVAFVEVSTDGGATWNTASGTTSWSYGWTPGADGTCNIRSRAIDSNNVTENPGMGVFVRIDRVPPVSAITYPGDGASLSGTSCLIQGTASDGQTGSGVRMVEVSTDGGGTWQPATGTTSWSYSWPLPRPGQYTIKSRAKDYAGWTESPGPGITVTSKAVYYPLSVTASPVGCGSVSCFPSSIDNTYIEGQSVSLSACPQHGYKFVTWNGDISSTSNPATVIMDSAKNIAASFAQLATYQLIVNVNPPGTGGVTLNPSYPGNIYTEGENVQLTATPASGYVFDSWSGDISGALGCVLVTMSSNMTVTANFVPKKKHLAVSSNNPAWGKVTPSSGDYEPGTIVQITATPSIGYKFKGWTGDLISSDNPSTVTMDADKNITAVFEQDPGTMPSMLKQEWKYGLFGSCIGESNIAVADIDGDGKPEMVMAGTAAGDFGDNDFFYVVKQTAPGVYEQMWVSNVYPTAITRIVAADVNGDGAAEIFVGFASGTVKVFDGHTMQETGSFDTGHAIVALAIADVDGDGNFEAVTSDGTDLYVYNASYFSLKWNAPGWGGEDIAIGDVDNDQHPEIVVAGSHGYVIDGVNHSLKWDYAGGFGVRVRIGGVDGDGKNEIVGAASWYTITVFDATAQTTKFTISTSQDIDALRVVDTNGDGIPEILYGDGQWGSVHCYDGVGRKEAWAIRNPEHGVTDIAVGDVNGDGTPELLWGAGATSTGPDYLYVADIPSRTITWQNVDLDGPLTAVDVGDVDGDGNYETVMASYSSQNRYADGVIQVFDAKTHALKWRSTDLPNITAWSGVCSLQIADVDGDGAAEYIIATANCYDGVVQVYDGKTHTLKMQTASYFGASFKSMAIGDVDGDGKLEIVAGQNREHTGADGVHVVMFDGKTGQEKWKSPVLGDYWGCVYDVKLADIDGDGHVEIIASLGDYLYVFDGVTHSLKYSAAVPAYAVEVADLYGDGKKEVLVGGNDGTVYVYDSSFNLTGTYNLGNGIIGCLKVDDLYSDGSREWLVGDDDSFYVYDGQSKELLWHESGLGGSVGKYNHIITRDIYGQGRKDVVVGSHYALYQYDSGTQFYVSAGPDKIANAQYTQTATVIDDKSMTYQWSMVSGPGVVTFGAPTAISTTISATADGIYDLRFTATDTANSVSSSDMALVWDTTAPTSTIIAPTAAATLNGTNYTISGTATDGTGSGVQKVEVGITPSGGSTTWYTTTGTTPWNHTWVLPAYGSYIIQSRATDNAGNVETPGSGITVTVDNGTVTANITSPTNSSAVNGLVPIQASAFSTGGFSISSVQVSIGGGAYTAMSGSGPYTYSWDTTSYVNGSTHTISVKATNINGQTGTATSIVTVDNGTVTASIVSPANGSTNLSGAITIKASASSSSGYGISSAQISVDGTNLSTTLVGSYWQANWPTSPANNGSHTITVSATNVNGKTGSGSATVTVYNNPVTVIITNPAGNATVHGVVSITATATEALPSAVISSVQISIDGGPYQGMVWSASYQYSWDTRSLSNGTAHTITVRATDSADNTNTQGIGVTVNNGTVTTSVVSPANGSSVHGVVTIQCSASTDVGDITGVTISLDGVTLATNLVGSLWQASWDTTAVTNNTSHTIKVVATNTNGQTATGTVTVTVDNGTVTTGIVSPASNSMVYGTIPIQAAASSSGGFGIASVRVSIDGGTYQVMSPSGSNWQYSWNTSQSTNAAHTINVLATNVNGQTGTASCTVTVCNNTVIFLSFVAQSGTSVTLSAAMYNNGKALSGEYIAFYENIGTWIYSSKGSATTNSLGVATLKFTSTIGSHTAYAAAGIPVIKSNVLSYNIGKVQGLNIPSSDVASKTSLGFVVNKPDPALSWTAFTGATAYHLQLSSSSAFPANTATTTYTRDFVTPDATATNVSWPGWAPSAFQLAMGKMYYWRVQAMLPSGTSMWSDYRTIVYKAGANIAISAPVSVVGSKVTVTATLTDASSIKLYGKTLTFYDEAIGATTYMNEGTSITAGATSTNPSPGGAVKSWTLSALPVPGTRQVKVKFGGDGNYLPAMATLGY